jgi:signal transduction histidine kinase
MSEKTIEGLLIEDDPNDALLFMSHMKSGLGPSAPFDFKQAATLKRAFEILALGGIEVILLDVMLPDSRGIDTVQKLRDRFPEIPIVVLTGLPDEAIGIEALRIGAQDYLVKGNIDGHGLRRTISYAVERNRMLLDLRRVEQLRAEIKERERMDRLKDELMSTVSHEMRNPLAVIKVVACGLRDGLRGEMSKKQLEMIAMQYRSIQRLEKIVGRILDLSRLESGKAHITPRMISPSFLISDTVKSFELIGENPKIKIIEEVPPDLPKIYVDPELFVQVLTNLIDNGLRYAHSFIRIRAEAVDRAPEIERSQSAGGVAAATGVKLVRISVVDDGNGIPQDRIPDLFNKFVQVNRSSKGEGYKGTGLGLAICKEIIERHSGKIWVESAEGIGSAFRFELPQEPPREGKSLEDLK